MRKAGKGRWLLTLTAAAAVVACGGASKERSSTDTGQERSLVAEAVASADLDGVRVTLASTSTPRSGFPNAASVSDNTRADQFFYAESFDRVTVYRFVRKQGGGHFYTASATERDAVIASLADIYQYEGPAFHAYAKAHALTRPVYRFYNRQTGNHLYTVDEQERSHILASLPQFSYDGVAYYVSAVAHDTVKPLHRFYHRRLGYHFYTASEEERAHVAASHSEFAYEGVAYSVFGSASVPWQEVGGTATAKPGSTTTQPFLQFAPGLSAGERVGLSQGRELFVAQWTPAPGARATLDGLGPLFIADACTSCHVDNGRAPSLLANGSVGRGILFRIGNRDGAVSPSMGGQLQDRATSGQPEGTVTWSAPLDDGQIAFALAVTGAGLEPGMNLGPRLSPHLIGMGLLDLVPTSQILAFADPDDTDGNGISGRPHWLPDGSLGRFGWKAINQTLRHQIAGALHQDMGLTTSLHAEENCTSSQTICASQPGGGSPEVIDESLDNMTRFMTGLAVPARRVDDLSRFQAGAKLFSDTGCAQCHRPVLRTGGNEAFPSLSGQLIYPYTDLLLHDMGSDLDDGVQEINAKANEWRTPPLWGIGLVAAGSNARFLHDGRASTIDQAVRWHGGEALAVRKRYQALSEADRDTLLAFVKGL